MANEIFGPIDYGQLSRAVAGSDIGITPYTYTFNVSGGTTFTDTDTEFTKSAANIISVISAVTVGSTDLDVQIHEDDNFDKSDMVYRATEVSSADVEPTGGHTAQGSGIPYIENNGSEQIHLKFVENSGVDATGYVKVYYI